MSLYISTQSSISEKIHFCYLVQELVNETSVGKRSTLLSMPRHTNFRFCHVRETKVNL